MLRLPINFLEVNNMSNGDREYREFVQALDKYHEYYGAGGQRKKSDLELHIEDLEEKRRQRLNEYCGFSAY